MDPSTLSDLLKGGLFWGLVFATPIISVVAATTIILAAINRRHKERMKMIEQGMMPPPPRQQKGNYNGLLIAGAILLAFGLALLAGALASRGNDFTGGFIFGFIGLAMLACFAIIRAARKNEPADKTDACQPPPPPLPPKP